MNAQGRHGHDGVQEPGTRRTRKVGACERWLIHQRGDRGTARHPAAEPVLRLTFDVEAGGLSDGASALFLITGGVHTDSGRNLSLGTAAPVLKQLGFRTGEGGNTPYTTQVAAEWTLTDTAIERIEKIRDGGNLVIYPNFEYALISPGTAMPSWPQPQRPLRVPFPGQPIAMRVDAHHWVDNVLEQ